MIDKIKELIEEAEVFTAQTKEEVEDFRIKYLGKKDYLMSFLLSLEMWLTTKKRIWSSYK